LTARPPPAGENCTSSDTGYTPSDVDCYSVRNLNLTVDRVNRQITESASTLPVRLVIIGGDITASAQPSEFQVARAYLERLTVPFIATMGNHDVWSYDQVRGDLTPSPRGDELFATYLSASFHHFASLKGGSRFQYPNSSSSSASGKPRRYQSWSLRTSAADFGPEFDGLTFLAPDFNTRLKAPPPCPGHSPVGGCGVMGMASLNNSTGGAWEWFEAQLQAVDNEPADAVRNQSIVLLTHQPFRCRLGIPDWYFCFSGDDKMAIRDSITRHRAALPRFWGQLAGHQHRFYTGTAFDEPRWGEFLQVCTILLILTTCLTRESRT
jgi:predicted MPP superfamily phosphohydrolase